MITEQEISNALSRTDQPKVTPSPATMILRLSQVADNAAQISSGSKTSIKYQAKAAKLLKSAAMALYRAAADDYITDLQYKQIRNGVITREMAIDQIIADWEARKRRGPRRD